MVGIHFRNRPFLIYYCPLNRNDKKRPLKVFIQLLEVSLVVDSFLNLSYLTVTLDACIPWHTI